MASTTFDLPQPLGPTTAVIPDAKLIVVGSKKDLKPTNSRLFKRMRPTPPPHHHEHLIPRHYKADQDSILVNRAHRPTRGFRRTLSDLRDGDFGHPWLALILLDKTWLVLNQFSVPVGAIALGEKRHPLAISPKRKHFGPERSPLGPTWPGDERHRRFLGRLSALPAVAVVARANNVLPRRRPATRARNHVIEIQF